MERMPYRAFSEMTQYEASTYRVDLIVSELGRLFSTLFCWRFYSCVWMAASNKGHHLRGIF